MTSSTFTMKAEGMKQLKLILLTIININFAITFATPKLLIKFPTRQRAEKFFKVLDMYYEKLSGEVPTHFLISCDLDDTGPNGMHRPSNVKKLKQYKNLSFYFSNSKGKIEAVNRDIDKHLNFDVILVASDDMIPQVKGYDKIVIDTMQKHFPDTDGTLNFNDGFVGNNLNTIPIMGKKYYERFNYVYYPKYISICSDSEFTLVAKMLGKEHCVDNVIIRHEHGGYGFDRDELFYKNESREYYLHDRAILEKRKSENFGLKVEEILPKYQLPTSLDLFNYKGEPIKLSILIATIDKRQDKFTELYRSLIKQIHSGGFEHKVEVVFFKDNQTHNVGYKRNKLIEASKGEYVCFVDDDDKVHENYVKILYDALKTNPDCVSCTGTTYKPNKEPFNFVHSLKYHKAFKENNVAYSPVYHLNPVRREYAIKAKFPDQNYNEDTTWARRLYDLKLLKTEVEIKEPYYFYYLDYNKSEAIPEAARKDRRIRWNPYGMLVISHE